MKTSYGENLPDCWNMMPAIFDDHLTSLYLSAYYYHQQTKTNRQGVPPFSIQGVSILSLFWMRIFIIKTWRNNQSILVKKMEKKRSKTSLHFISENYCFLHNWKLTKSNICPRGFLVCAFTICHQIWQKFSCHILKNKLQIAFFLIT